MQERPPRWATRNIFWGPQKKREAQRAVVSDTLRESLLQTAQEGDNRLARRRLFQAWQWSFLTRTSTWSRLLG